MAALKYGPAKLIIKLSDEDIRCLFSSKVDTIFQKLPIQKPVEEAIDAVTREVSSRETKRGTYDQRYKTANARGQEAGVIPAGTSSPPQKAAKEDPSYIEKLTTALHNGYGILISLLKEELSDRQVTDLPKEMAEVVALHRVLCNDLDEATAIMLMREPARGSITTAVVANERTCKMYDQCVEIVVTWKALLETRSYNVLNEKEHMEWKTQMQIVASLGALAVALKRLLG